MTTNIQVLAASGVEDATGVRVAEALAFSFLIGLCAQARIYLPFTPVPITGQTLAVLAGGSILGAGYGMLAVFFYLAEAVLGLPFFAGGASGAGHLFGPTARYLVGFLPAAGLAGVLPASGLWPFLPGDLLKTLVLAGLLPAWRTMADGIDGR